jgi:hypothetical protein
MFVRSSLGRGTAQSPGAWMSEGVGGEQAAADSSGKVRLLATGDLERLRRRHRKATGKKVDLLLPA